MFLLLMENAQNVSIVNGECTECFYCQWRMHRMFLLLMENAQNVSIVNGECTECFYC